MIQVFCLASGSTGNSYAVDDGKTVLLLEAGIPAKKICSGYLKLLPRVAGCLITHEHQDHSKGAADLADRGVDLYMTSGTRNMVTKTIRPYRIHIVRAEEQIKVGSWIVLPFEAEHDAEEPVGYLLASTFTHEKLLFATDTYFIRYRFSSVNIFMIECNYSLPILQGNIASGKIPQSLQSRLLRSHFSLENLIDFFRATDLSAAKQIYLIHTSAGNGDKELFKKEIQRTTGIPVEVL